MSEMGFQFRTAAFGGFRKEDVMAYLEQSSKAHIEKVNALQRELDEVKAQRAEGEEHGTALSTEVGELKAEKERLTAELAAAAARRDALEALSAQLQAEVDGLRPSAEAYEAIKERMAGIELEAHGRAKAIEEEGRRRAKEFQDRVAAWFEKVCGAYDRMRGDLDAILNHALREMSRTHQNLEDLSGDFVAHDKTLAELRAAMEELPDRPAAQPPEPLPLDGEAR